MALAVFLLLAVLAAVAIAYPLLPGRARAETGTLSDPEIEAAVRRLRRARSGEALACPACGQAYRRGDRFCVACGRELPGQEPAVGAAICPSCGARLRAEDQFCARCGHRLAAGEVE